MARLFFPSSASTVTCRRCGNSLPSDADTCPHCGADHGGTGGTFSARKTAMFTTGLRLPFGPRREAVGAPSPYPSLPEESELAGTGEQRWDNSKTITLGAVMLALITGGVIYSQYGENDSSRSGTLVGHSAYGAIDMKAARDTPVPSAAPAPVTKSAAAPVAKQAPAMAPSTVARTVARDALPADTTNHTAAALASTTDNLQATRDAIERGDLTTARRRFSKIPAAQLGAANVQRTQAELTILERTRDGLLQVARGCEATGSWLCVRQNARDVLGIDASNVEAQTLVEHAITRSGWLNKTPPAVARTAPRPNGATPLATPTAPAFVAGPRSGTAAPVPAPTPTPTRRSAAVAATHMRPIPVMPTPVVVPAPLPAVAATKAVPAAPVSSDSTRVGTGSHVPLTTPAYTAAPASSPQPAAVAHPSTSTSTFVPMPDGPETAPVRAASPNASPANAPAPPVVHVTPLVEPVSAHAATTQAPDDVPSTPVIRTLAPITEAVPVPVRSAAAPQATAAISAPGNPGIATSQTTTRSLASGDNATSGAHPKAPAYNATNSDAEERAILESGWSKSQSSKQRPPGQ